MASSNDTLPIHVKPVVHLRVYVLVMSLLIRLWQMIFHELSYEAPSPGTLTANGSAKTAETRDAADGQAASQPCRVSAARAMALNWQQSSTNVDI